jgi:hypothetical protein
MVNRMAAGKNDSGINPDFHFLAPEILRGYAFKPYKRQKSHLYGVALCQFKIR